MLFQYPGRLNSTKLKVVNGTSILFTDLVKIWHLRKYKIQGCNSRHGLKIDYSQLYIQGSNYNLKTVHEKNSRPKAFKHL